MNTPGRILIALATFAALPGVSQAGLIYENVNGVELIDDTATNTVWLRNGNLGGQTYTFQDATSWAASLSFNGLPGWTFELPTLAEFTSLFTDLYPYGAPGTQSNKFGASVAFGSGQNDSALNVQTIYWTVSSGTDFNFFYGYGGGEPNTTSYGAWAVVAEMPEPSSWALTMLAIGAAAVVTLKRRLA